MDPRRLLILAALGLSLSGCALLRDYPVPSAPVAAIVPAPADGPTSGAAVEPEPAPAAVETAQGGSGSERPYEAGPTRMAITSAAPPEGSVGATGRPAIAAANAAAREPSREDGFVGGVQVFAWSPGRVFEVWTAPLRVTTLTLAPGETLVAKAAGDTVRWQIGEAVSGTGAGRRTHVLLKPLERGLETNLVLTTNRRVYLIDLKSGAADAFNTAVAWDADPFLTGDDVVPSTAAPVAEPVATLRGDPDARYRIEPRGRRPRWTPTSVFNDGLRTFITFDPDMQVDEAPALFVIATDGEAQMVNYRQVGGLFVVDRVFDRAELRLGDRRPQIVSIRRLPGGRS
ncbi:TrbG/VirB9 family P-type conjugative transfer protein [Brevundimonas sp.]|uniref:TrbG/VirB9 family P-type conjugative transfer protein n=1 Tax=Brevundimonas sp. TaxID=1871086 RepID=UPI002C0EE56A|nr:TrbG/VirB9 family P-type conjugative transfer protein [Brevundimonas sp.]HWQ85402.1 TrbG/VirB9 family P-type conjugative transfer protein [Brevundimonas sp.]